MADLSIPARKNRLIAAVAVFAVCMLVGGSVMGSIFHVHKSAAAEATCPICQISHCVAVRTIPAVMLTFPHLLAEDLVSPFRSAAHSNYFLTLDLTRAPPSI